MQLVPSTARRFGVADVFNPAQNIEGGTKYLKYLLNLYDDHLGLALAAYNAGENAVAKYGTVPPYRETQDYLRLVATELKKENIRKREREQAKPAVTAPPAGPHHIREIVEPDGTVRYVTR
jgi:soluble lytic murein transglycosylase-like protein